MSADNSTHYGQGMIIKRRGRPPTPDEDRIVPAKTASKYGLDARMQAIEDGDVTKLLEMAAEYEQAGRTIQAAACLKIAEAFTDKKLEATCKARKSGKEKSR